MRQAGTIPDQSHARLFSDYLLAKGIAARVTEEAEGFAVWIIDEEKVTESRRELDEFLRDPDNPQYVQVAKGANDIRREEKRKRQEYQRNLVDVRGRWSKATVGRCPITIGLIAISVVLSFWSGFGKNWDLTKWLYIAEVTLLGDGTAMWYGLTAIYEKGQVWRLVTPIFVHVGGPLHLIFNMYWTYQFGTLIESRRGPWRHLGLVLLVAIASNLSQYAWAGPFFGGMSGVVYGQFGYLWMKSKFDRVAAISLPPRLVQFFLIWLVVCMTGLLGPIANTAHFVGLFTGMAIGYAPVLIRNLRSR